MRARSQRKRSHPKNTDHENIRWIMKTAVNRSADCQAWNLLVVSCRRAKRPRQSHSRLAQGGRQSRLGPT
jgi:hypothetical protein